MWWVQGHRCRSPAADASLRLPLRDLLFAQYGDHNPIKPTDRIDPARTHATLKRLRMRLLNITGLTRHSSAASLGLRTARAGGSGSRGFRLALTCPVSSGHCLLENDGL
jgi:hypothetical protein